MVHQMKLSKMFNNMKNIIRIFIIFIAVTLSFNSCEPVEKRNTNDKPNLTEADLLKYVTVTPEIREGKRSNWIVMNADGLKGTPEFVTSVGTFTGHHFRVQVFTLGDQTVTCTILNSDGKKVSKDFGYNVEAYFDMGEEWEWLCGYGKDGYVVWRWDETQGNKCWGMGSGGNSGNNSDWWQPGPDGNASPGEWLGAKMTLTFDGLTLVKHKTDGTEESGKFLFNPAGRNESGYSRTIAKFYTVGTTVLSGISVGSCQDGWEDPIYEYEVIELSKGKLVLNDNKCHEEMVTWWVFRDDRDPFEEPEPEPEPEYDFSAEVEFTGRFTNPEGVDFALADIILGEDVNFAKVALIPGDFEDAVKDGTFEDIIKDINGDKIENIKLEEDGSVSFECMKSGVYSIVVITCDKDKKVQEYFYVVFDFPPVFSGKITSKSFTIKRPL